MSAISKNESNLFRYFFFDFLEHFKEYKSAAFNKLAWVKVQNSTEEVGILQNCTMQCLLGPIYSLISAVQFQE